MIIKKNISKIPFLKEIKNLILKIILVVGVTTIIFTTVIVGYYYNSGMHDRFAPSALIKKIDNVILDRYIGFSIFEIDDYIKIKLTSLKFIFIKNKFENVSIEIDQKNLYNLELQRNNRMSGSQEKGNFSQAKIKSNKKNMILN